jgi:methyl-accepting chemotaxis protein
MDILLRKGTTMPLMSKKRIFFSVTSSLQYRFLAMTLTYGFIVVSIFIIAVMGPDISEMHNERLSPEIRSSAAHRFIAKNTWIWPAAFALIALLGVHSFIEFQRVMGPLYRFRWVFKQLETGHLLSAVTTRKKDYLKEELADLNDMVSALEHHIRAIRQDSETALNSIAELESSIGSRGDLNPVQLSMLQAHRQHIEQLASAVRFFRLHDEQQKVAEIQQETSEHHNVAVKETKNGISNLAGG